MATHTDKKYYAIVSTEMTVNGYVHNEHETGTLSLAKGWRDLKLRFEFGCCNQKEKRTMDLSKNFSLEYRCVSGCLRKSSVVVECFYPPHTFTVGTSPRIPAFKARVTASKGLKVDKRVKVLNPWIIMTHADMAINEALFGKEIKGEVKAFLDRQMPQPPEGILSEAERRYQQYKSDYISTLKLTYFEGHKEEEWLRNKYHPKEDIDAAQAEDIYFQNYMTDVDAPVDYLDATT